MRVIIPVAGFGSRLRPHTYTRPKVLPTVAGKPIPGHILDGGRATYRLPGVVIVPPVFIAPTAAR